MAERKSNQPGFKKGTQNIKTNTKVRKPSMVGKMLAMIFFGADAAKEY